MAIAAVLALAALFVSGGSPSDPHTPAALPGLPAPFLPTAVLGDGASAAGVDAYGDVVDLWVPGPVGRDLIQNPASRQAADSVPPNTGIVPRVSIAGGPARALWHSQWVRQSYLPDTNILRTAALIGSAKVEIIEAISRGALTCTVSASRGARVSGLSCQRPGGWRSIRQLARAERRWLGGAKPLDQRAPRWAKQMYRRSLLVLRALTDSRSGAVAAGTREGWAYVWPRDASATAIALASAGYREEARLVVHFLLRLNLGSAARFAANGAGVKGRAAEGDAGGWVEAAARAAGLRSAARRLQRRGAKLNWRDRNDYQERSGQSGDFLANAIASRLPAARILKLFGSPAGLERSAHDPASGLDSAAAWAVRPFPQPTLFAAVRRTLDRLTSRGGRFGILPAEDWPGAEPWSAPTAWSAWSLAALGERGAALRLLGDLRRSATPTGLFPERVGAREGLPHSTTPLAWSHAFAILALRQLWPGSRQRPSQ